MTLRPAMAGFGEPYDTLWRYALSDGKLTILYLQNYGEKPSSGTIYVWTGTGDFKIDWIDPATGKVVKTESKSTTTSGGVTKQALVLQSPEVDVDMAAKITPATL